MSWKTFDRWLLSHPDPAHVLQFLLEVSTEFPRGELNALFRQQLAQRAAQIGRDDAQQQVIQLHDFDYIGYIARSLRSAGFQDADIDGYSHDLAVRLLVKPGQLFAGWDGKGPIVARFKVAVKNSIINMIQKKQTRRRNIPATSIHRDSQVAMDVPAPHQPESETLIDAFREFLIEKHGQAALNVFDERLAGGETKSLIGRPGLETSYKIKKVVQAIKKTAEEFGAGDPEFLSLVRRAMEDEAETVGKRFGVKQNSSRSVSS